MNLTLANQKIEQAFESFQEKQLDERCHQILHDLGIPIVMPTQPQSNLKQGSMPFKSLNLGVVAGTSD